MAQSCNACQTCMRIAQALRVIPAACALSAAWRRWQSSTVLEDSRHRARGFPQPQVRAQAHIVRLQGYQGRCWRRIVMSTHGPTLTMSPTSRGAMAPWCWIHMWMYPQNHLYSTATPGSACDMAQPYRCTSRQDCSHLHRPPLVMSQPACRFHQRP